MSAKASPRPWFVNGHSIEANDPDGLWLQNEKTGRGVVANLPSCPKSRMSKKNRETWDAIVEANAALLVDAVNERDRLRDIVRRLADLSESLLANYEYRYREDPNSMAFVGNARDFIREARAAIGGEKQ